MHESRGVKRCFIKILATEGELKKQTTKNKNK